MKAPRAAQLQAGSNGDDDALTAMVRSVRPQRRWWWGVRSWWVDLAGRGVSFTPPDAEDDSPIVPRRGAWCYLCDSPIVTWSSRWPVTEIALMAIRRHRSEHIQGRLDTPAQEMHA